MKFITGIILFSVVLFNFISVNAGETMSPYNALLHDEILAMYALDVQIREEGVASNFDPSVLKKVWELDQSHLVRLKEILHDFGWPGYALIGQEGSHAYWLLVQHTPDLVFQKECLVLLHDAVKLGDAAPADLAYLDDRVRVNENRKQLYGTQWQFVENKHTLYPVEDFAHLDERRASVGLKSFQEAIQEFMKSYHISENDISLGENSDETQ